MDDLPASEEERARALVAVDNRRERVGIRRSRSARPQPDQRGHEGNRAPD